MHEISDHQFEHASKALGQNNQMVGFAEINFMKDISSSFSETKDQTKDFSLREEKMDNQKKVDCQRLNQVHLRQLLLNEDATRRLAEDLAMIVRAGDCLLLKGDMGAGKTTFAQYFIRALLNDPQMDVPSPTYTIAQHYDYSRFPLYHLDLYRLEAPEDIEEIGFDAMVKEGLSLVEWPVKAQEYMPEDALILEFFVSKEGQHKVALCLSKKAIPLWSARLSRTMSARAFMLKSELGQASRRFMQGDASSRCYERLYHQTGSTIFMNDPLSKERERPKKQKEQAQNSYRQVAHLAEGLEPFIALSQTLKSAGYTTAEILNYDLSKGFLLSEDLGRLTLVEAGQPLMERYLCAIDVLGDLHQRSWPTVLTAEKEIRYTLPFYDREAFLAEIKLFTQWYLPYKKIECPLSQQEIFEQIFSEPISFLMRSEQSLVLRDYHSPNCLWLPEREGLQKIGIIDMQDAVIGPTAYDVVSLTQDARVDISPDMENSLLTHYLNQRVLQDSFNKEDFEKAYALCAVQRALKILGVFARLSMRDDKHHYLAHLPRVEAYLNRHIHHQSLQPLYDWFKDILPELIEEKPFLKDDA